ncbi:MAG: hypothetical protein IKW83_09090 [Muribaculaceae bacterium]|nr:hypothetical protein [Muribaculaceae bacterium]
MKNSKSVFFLGSVIFCSLILLLGSCNKSLKSGEKMDENEIKQLVEELNKNCPIKYHLLTATSYKCEGKNLVINYVVDEDKIVYSNLTDKTLYNIWRLCCIDEASETDKNVIKSLGLSGYGIKCQFNGSKSQKNMTFVVSNDKLKNNKPLTQEEIIENLVEIDRQAMPKVVDLVTQIVDFKVEKENILYVYEIDETDFDISIIENDSNYRENGTNKIANELRNNTLTGVLYKLVARSGRGICHRYIGKETGKVVNLQFSNAELRQIATANGVN